MTYPYRQDQILELVKAPKVLRHPELLVKGKPLPFQHYGEKGRRLTLDIDLTTNVVVLDLHFQVRGPVYDDPSTFEAVLVLAHQRIRGIGWDATGKKRFYRQAIPKGWHQNVINPNRPSGHPDQNRHLSINDFAPSDLNAFFTAAAKIWNITLPTEEYLL